VVKMFPKDGLLKNDAAQKGFDPASYQYDLAVSGVVVKNANGNVCYVGNFMNPANGKGKTLIETWIPKVLYDSAPDWFKEDHIWAPCARCLYTNTDITLGQIGLSGHSTFRYDATNCHVVLLANNAARATFARLYSEIGTDESRLFLEGLISLALNAVKGGNEDAVTFVNNHGGNPDVSVWENYIVRAVTSAKLISPSDNANTKKLIIDLAGDSEASSYYKTGQGMTSINSRLTHFATMITSAATNGIFESTKGTVEGYLTTKNAASLLASEKKACFYLAQMFQSDLGLWNTAQKNAEVVEMDNECPTPVDHNAIIATYLKEKTEPL